LLILIESTLLIDNHDKTGKIGALRVLFSKPFETVIRDPIGHITSPRFWRYAVFKWREMVFH